MSSLHEWGRVLGIGVADREEMGLHFVVFLHFRGVVFDLLLHVEAVLHQISMVLLQFQQDAVVAVPVFLGGGTATTIVLIDHPHVLLVQLYLASPIPSNSFLFFYSSPTVAVSRATRSCSCAFFWRRKSTSQFSDCSSCLASLGWWPWREWFRLPVMRVSEVTDWCLARLIQRI